MIQWLHTIYDVWSFFCIELLTIDWFIIPLDEYHNWMTSKGIFYKYSICLHTCCSIEVFGCCSFIKCILTCVAFCLRLWHYLCSCLHFFFVAHLYLFSVKLVKSIRCIIILYEYRISLSVKQVSKWTIWNGWVSIYFNTKNNCNEVYSTCTH